MTNAIDQLRGWDCRRQAISTLFILIWIASSDGQISGEEEQRIQEFARGTGSQDDLNELRTIATDPTDRNVLKVVHVLKTMPFESKHRLIEFAFILSLADNRITSGETQILRFLTDALSLSSKMIDDLFLHATGAPAPPASDLSSKSWWTKRTKERTQQDSRSDRGRHPRTELESDCHRHLSVLGLQDDCSQAEIRDAYRRLAAVHHPDKFVCLGPEAVAAAEATFRYIQEAYEQLKLS